MNLLELNMIVVEEQQSQRCFEYNGYIYGYIEEIISASRAPRLSLTVLAENNCAIERIPKVFRNEFIEHLAISAPCSFNLSLQMKNLKEVTLKLKVTEPGQPSCSFPRSRKNDRDLHRAGKCIIHLGALHGHCPSLVKFNGIQLGGMSKSFSDWNTKVRRLFYDDYISEGGELQFKAWAGSRWFKEPAVIPTVYGINRLPQAQQL